VTTRDLERLLGERILLSWQLVLVGREPPFRLFRRVAGEGWVEYDPYPVKEEER
jgi:hypothetical protein